MHFVSIIFKHRNIWVITVEVIIIICRSFADR